MFVLLKIENKMHDDACLTNISTQEKKIRRVI